MGRFVGEVLEGDFEWGYGGDLSGLQRAREIFDLDKETQIAVLLVATKELVSLSTGQTNNRSQHLKRIALKALCSRLLRGNRSYSDQDIVWLLEQSVLASADSWKIPMSGVMRTVERHCRHHGASPDVTAALNHLSREVENRLADYGGQDMEKLISRIQAIFSRDEQSSAQVTVESDWARQVQLDIAGRTTSKQAVWKDLLDHAGRSANKAAPAKLWSRQASGMVGELGADIFLDQLVGWLKAYPLDPAVREPNSDILKGLIWCAGLIGKEESAQVLGDFCRRCFTKVPDFGARSVSLGNACLWALGRLDGRAGIAQLCGLEKRVRYPSARNQIVKVLNEAADRAGLDRTDLEEIGVPDFELDPDGVRDITVGDYQARLAITGTKTISVTWITPDDKHQKSVPKTVKDDHADGVAAARKLARDIRDTLSGQAGRIERILLTGREWDYATWRTRYADHPLLAHLTRRLIWQVEDSGKRVSALAAKGGVEDVSGRVFEPTGSARVSLWHPIGSSVATVLAWRDRLAAKAISQPFKQAHREIYVLTEVERQSGTYSDRFAAHIIRQHMFHAICQQRGWAYTLQGGWDSHNVPTRVLDDLSMKVEFWVDSWPENTPQQVFIFEFVETGRVQFCDLDGTPRRLKDVAPAVFSELMRDVDLFVSTCSVGNDPTLEHGGPEGHYRVYWNNYAFGALSESAKLRQAVLERLLPRLEIASQCALEERFLVVRGRLSTYKIHLGSSNILMEPGSRHLCIVADRRRSSSATKIWLPFEGDTLLSIILSKAFMLADDSRITDEEVLRQIKAGT